MSRLRRVRSTLVSVRRPVPAPVLRVLALCAALALAACTPPGLPDPQPPDPSSSSAPSASSGGSSPAPSVSASSPVTTPAAEDPSLTIGLDAVVTGFNPYAIADASTATTAVAALTLPSVSVVDAAGRRQLDGTVVTSASVTSTDPFTVTYEISRAASWSDGTPVTAEDFRYLRDQLQQQTGVRGAAPYALITGIDSAAAGKQVRITFSTPVADWQSMFSPLLPAHILKDAPGGFLGGLSGGVPVTAGPYRFSGFDAVTGQITLRRNDKYWAAQPGPNGVVLRLGTPAELVAALGRGDVQAVLLEPGNTAAQQLSALIPPSDRTVVPLAASVTLVMDTTAGATASADVRRAIAAGLVPDVLDDAYTGSRPDGLLTEGSLVQLPAVDAAAGTRPPGVFADPAAAAEALAAAGWERGAGAAVLKGGLPLTLTLGYPTRVPALARTARLIQTQLGRIGIGVDVVADSDVIARLGQPFAGGRHVDLALVEVPRGTSDSIEAISSYGCPAGGAAPGVTTAQTTGASAISSAGASTTAGSGTSGAASGTGVASTTGTDATPRTTPAGTTDPPAPTVGTTVEESSVVDPGTADAATEDPPGSGGAVTDLRHGANLAGWCNAELQPTLLQLLAEGTEGNAGRQTLSDVGTAVLAALPVIPLGQPQAVFAVAPELRSVLSGSRAGWLWTGPLAGLAGWDHR